MRILIKIVIPLVALLLMSVVANSECERCSDSRLACTGDSEKEILNKCGPPTKTYYHYNIFNQIVAVEYWYDLGSGKATRSFTFRNGFLSAIGTVR
jgi:hypothetical protein